MAQKILLIILRSVIAYLVLLSLSRLIGRKLISKITFFDFVVGITLGSLAVRISLGGENSILLGIVSAVVITALVLATDLLGIKSSLFRKIEEGEPIVLIQRGKMLDRNLAKTKISVSKLLMMLRQKDIFYVEDVDYAVIENDGQLSVLLQPDRLPAAAGDLRAAAAENTFPADVIIDGKILPESLKSSGHDEAWLRQQLQAQGIHSPGQVFYASINRSGGLYLSPFRDRTG